MFAAATREVVFSNPAVIERVNKEFIPVALKAALVNNPPPGLEGKLYAEIGRSKPAPQGICTVNSAGKVLAWALSFDDDDTILDFLDHVAVRYRQSPDADRPVTAERFMRFPSHQLADVADNGLPLEVPDAHATDDRCPAQPPIQRGTLVGRIVGRALDQDGQPLGDTRRQEHYMEARFAVSLFHQRQLAAAAEEAAGDRFPIPRGFADSLIQSAFLGQLDVNPSGGVPGSENRRRVRQFWGQEVDVDESGVVRIRIQGTSCVEGRQRVGSGPRSDGRLWEHRVALDWHGYVDLDDGRLAQLAVVAFGAERLRWGNARFNLLSASEASHLMAGHAIDLDCSVRYGLFATPHPGDDVALLKSP